MGEIPYLGCAWTLLISFGELVEKSFSIAANREDFPNRGNSEEPVSTPPNKTGVSRPLPLVEEKCVCPSLLPVSPRNCYRADCEGDTHQASQVKRSAPALCLLRSCLRRNVAPLEGERVFISTGYSAAQQEERKNDVPANSTIRLDTLTGVWVVANVHSSVFFGAVGTDAHLATPGETASRLSAKANGFRKGCEELSRYSFVLGGYSSVLRAALPQESGGRMG